MKNLKFICFLIFSCISSANASQTTESSTATYIPELETNEASCPIWIQFQQDFNGYLNNSEKQKKDNATWKTLGYTTFTILSAKKAFENYAQNYIIQQNLIELTKTNHTDSFFYRIGKLFMVPTEQYAKSDLGKYKKNLNKSDNDKAKTAQANINLQLTQYYNQNNSLRMQPTKCFLTEISQSNPSNKTDMAYKTAILYTSKLQTNETLDALKNHIEHDVEYKQKAEFNGKIAVGLTTTAVAILAGGAYLYSQKRS